MLLGKKRKLGRKVEDMSVGEKLKLTEKIEDRNLLLYLGITNDGNPLYIQHDFASQTFYEKPIVPPVMLTGIVTSAISRYLPGPGSHIVEQHLIFPKPVYHYSTVDFLLQVISVDIEKNNVVIEVHATNEDGETVIEGKITSTPPRLLNRLTSQTMDNF